jgi:AcrR family transcriptional regulator
MPRLTASTSATGQGTRRARSTEAKAARFESILDAACALYEAAPTVEAVGIEDVARAAGVAKGTVYLYAPSKEALFLALYDRTNRRWFDRIDARFAAKPAADPAVAGYQADAARAASAAIVGACMDVPLMARLNAALHGSLEPRLDPEALYASKRGMLDRLDSFTRALARVLGVSARDAASVMPGIFACLIGCHHLASPPPHLAALYDRDDMAPFRFDFARLLGTSLRDLFLGHLAGLPEVQG